MSDLYLVLIGLFTVAIAIVGGLISFTNNSIRAAKTEWDSEHQRLIERIRQDRLDLVRQVREDAAGVAERLIQTQEAASQWREKIILEMAKIATREETKQDIAAAEARIEKLIRSR